MKHDKLRKLTRNRLLLEMHQKNLNTSLEEIGEIFNISRQRVQMILKKEKERLLKEARNAGEVEMGYKGGNKKVVKKIK